MFHYRLIAKFDTCRNLQLFHVKFWLGIPCEVFPPMRFQQPPKTWNALSEDVTSSQSEKHLPSLNTPFAASSKRGFSRSFFWTSSSDTDCNLTFSLGLSVPTWFCRLRTTIRYMIYDMIWWWIHLTFYFLSAITFYIHSFIHCIYVFMFLLFMFFMYNLLMVLLCMYLCLCAFWHWHT